MPECKHYKICRRNAEENTEEGLCILHSRDPEKDEEAFEQALASHREENGDNFQHFVFPGHVDYFKGARFTESASFFCAIFNEGADFSSARFNGWADFSDVKFVKSAKFLDATFTKGAMFSHAEFTEGADFCVAKFTEQASFSSATFSKHMAYFSEAEFSKEANFSHATFIEDAYFAGVTFTKGADFSGATFVKGAEFFRARFLGRTRFLSRQENGNHIPIFFETVVSFKEVDMAPDAVVFQDADLRKCRFLGTDLRKTWFANVTWPEIVPKRWTKIGRRRGVYDEDWAEQKSDNRSIPHIEELYRQLKQNYEDRHDYERARDFHYGEKEMRRKNPDHPLHLRLLLKLYCCVSGYGELSLRPLGWAVGLLIASAVGYLGLGLWSNESKSMLEWSDWVTAFGL